MGGYHLRKSKARLPTGEGLVWRWQSGQNPKGYQEYAGPQALLQRLYEAIAQGRLEQAAKAYIQTRDQLVWSGILPQAVRDACVAEGLHPAIGRHVRAEVNPW